MVSARSHAVPPFPLARFSVEQYHRMIESGAFTEDDHVELIDGWVVQQIAKGPGHEYSVGQCDEVLRSGVRAGWHVRNQSPITLASSEPEPDRSVARGDRNDYRDHHPGARDLALVVEVSDTSLDTDRTKARTYGTAGIPIYWLVNLVDRCVEVYTRPDPTSGTGYANREVFGESDTLPARFADVELDLGSVTVRTLLP